MEMSKEKRILSGNQAIARGFYEAGGSIAASYPGSPTVELMQTLIDEYGDHVYSEFSTNEKVALEVAIGGSFAGARSMVSMKHVGVNIAADPLMTFTQTSVNGGFLLVSGEDPGMSSSQNEQDNRVLGKFANMAILDPSCSQEAKEFTKLGLDMSEEYHMPIMLRITSRLCHSRSIVDLCERKSVPIRGFQADQEKYCMLPPHTFKAQHRMTERIKALAEKAEKMEINKLEELPGSETLIICSGLPYENLKELRPKADIYKLGMVYPMPIEKIRKMAKKYKKILVLEELLPFMENELKLNGIPCEGKLHFSFTREIGLLETAKGLLSAKVDFDNPVEADKEIQKIVDRKPMFCAGCPHRPVFDILKKSGALVVGDIGCYSLGILYPFEVLQTNISMGAGVSILKGMRKALRMKGENAPLATVIGDGTFFHSGMPAFVNLLKNIEPDDNMTIIILDNRATAMTGGQSTASSGRFKRGFGMEVDFVSILKSIGLERVKTVDQFKLKEASKIINEELKHQGLSIIITTRPCALKYKIKERPFYVDPDICIGCRTCVKTNCPPIIMRAYQGHEKLKSSIDPRQCVGCSVCAQVCPVGAIKRVREKKEGEK